MKSLGKSIIRMYSMGACATIGMSNQDALSKELQCDPLLNSTLQKFICKLYYRFGSFLTPLSVRLITSRHYLLEQNVAATTNDRATSNNKDPKKVEVGKRLAEYNCKKREELAKAQKSEPRLTSSQYYAAGAIVAIGYLPLKEGDVTSVH